MNLLTRLTLHAEGIDEWYGLTAKFDWTDAGKARKKIVDDAERATAGLSPEDRRRAHTHATALEHALVEDIARELLASPEAAAFYAKPRRVEVEDFGGGVRTRTIPRFTPAHFSDWNFWADGGVISASERD